MDVPKTETPARAMGFLFSSVIFPEMKPFCCANKYEDRVIRKNRENILLAMEALTKIKLRRYLPSSFSVLKWLRPVLQQKTLSSLLPRRLPRHVTELRHFVGSHRHQSQ